MPWHSEFALLLPHAEVVAANTFTQQPAVVPSLCRGCTIWLRIRFYMLYLGSLQT
jgi:hypothetical protein